MDTNKQRLMALGGSLSSSQTLHAGEGGALIALDNMTNNNSGLSSKVQQQQHQQTATTKKRPIISADGAIRDPEEYKRRLHEELLSRNRSQNRGMDHQIRSLSLNFRNRDYEEQFRETADIASSISLAGLPLTLTCSFVSYLLTQPM